MQKPPLDPDVADAAPIDSMLTPYDHEHLITYLRLIDADAEGADLGIPTIATTYSDRSRPVWRGC